MDKTILISKLNDNKNYYKYFALLISNKVDNEIDFELIINQNINCYHKIEYINKAYNEDLYLNNTNNIKIEGIKFFNKYSELNGFY